LTFLLLFIIIIYEYYYSAVQRKKKLREHLTTKKIKSIMSRGLLGLVRHQMNG